MSNRSAEKALAAANKFFSEEPWWLENMVRRVLETGYDPLPRHPDALPDFTSEAHIWPCELSYSHAWTGGGFSGKPLERKPGIVCICPWDNSELPQDPKPMVWQSSHKNLHGVRLEYTQLLKGTGYPRFDPRDGYSKNEMDYKK